MLSWMNSKAMAFKYSNYKDNNELRKHRTSTN